MYLWACLHPKSHMTTETKPELITVDPRDVTFIIHRDRDEKEFRRVKESIRQMGIRIPLRVREIEGKKKWQAFYGEGRCRAAIELYNETRDKSFLAVPALLDTKSSESEIAVAFLTENISRSSLSWDEQAGLIRAELGDRKPDRKTVKALAKAFFVSDTHILRLLRILRKLSPDLEKELRGMTVGDAEALISMPAKEQEIVFETLREEGLAKSDVAAVVKRAKRVVEEGTPLSKTALRHELKRVREDLERARKTAKPLRLHYALGVENLRVLLANNKWRKALEKEGVNFAKFEEALGK
jgi:ParB-like chromosome segregation protein Spo0J